MDLNGDPMISRTQIRRYASKIGRTFRPRQVILFGSYAHRNPTEDSDVDLLVIMDHDKPRNVDQAIAIRLSADAPFAMDLLVKRPSEVTERLAIEDSFLREIIENGEFVFERARVIWIDKAEENFNVVLSLRS